VKILKPKSGQKWQWQWFHSYKVAASQIKFIIGIKRLKKPEADDIRAAVAKHKARQQHRLSMHPEDFPRYTWSYLSAPKLARYKACSPLYMKAGRIIQMQHDSAQERRRRLYDADLEHGLVTGKNEKPVDGALFWNGEIDLFAKDGEE
jgi:hypothetical protein